MTENDQMQFAREGENTLVLDSEKENSSESSTEETTTEETQSSEGDSTQNDETKPFNEHPAWKERETQWTERFNQQETRHQEDIKNLRDEFTGTREARKENAENTKIPGWFGGNQEQWNAYRQDRDAELAQAEERALKRITDAKSEESKAVQEATAYMQTEMTAIEGDKTLNPNGAKIDPNKLLKFVLDNDLVDSKGRWNYRAGFRLMQAQTEKPKPKVDEDKKKLAGATNSNQRGETKAPQYKTSKDFEKNKPW